MSRTLAITTSSFDLDNPAIRTLEEAGWTIVRNPHGRKMTEAEVSDLLETSGAEAMIPALNPSPEACSKRTRSFA